MNTLPLWVEIPAALLIVLSGLWALTGSIGLLRFRSFSARIHAPAIINTLGTASLVAASILVWLALDSGPIFQEILILLFLAITSPVTAMTLMQAARGQARDTGPDNTD